MPLPLLILLLLLAPLTARAQFVDTFDDGDVEGWDFFTGDGVATMDFVAHDGFARLSVDATDDRHNVWWAILKRPVSEFVDLERLADPGTELRVEARIRLSDAPRRVNIMINTNRTTDFHEHLAEFDVADTTDWHTISYTTTDLDARPGDTLYVQLGVTDWGLGTYHLDLDAYRAAVVDTPAEADLGEPRGVARRDPRVGEDDAGAGGHGRLERREIGERPGPGVRCAPYIKNVAGGEEPRPGGLVHAARGVDGERLAQRAGERGGVGGGGHRRRRRQCGELQRAERRHDGDRLERRREGGDVPDEAGDDVPGIRLAGQGRIERHSGHGGSSAPRQGRRPGRDRAPGWGGRLPGHPR